ncbi:aminodeoxychorismate lyase [Bacillus lacus]|uniref:Aminodeoxychorismate lyase n=1 Tax=Metabacillus lacus TaxID=1983721 RepID=A0A7X2LXW4_9BACI|nr:aminodeoxychorismate lyase [Metabacillus lacus]MRX72980.1 aminodeoxychorismate lyase [Metabacillus lacus]
MIIYCNGEFVEENKAVISPFDHGYLYGLGVFETFRVYKGFPFLIDDHVRRLNDSMGIIGIDAAVNRQDVMEMIKELLIQNDLLEKDAYVRLNVSAGTHPVGLTAETYTDPVILCFIKEIPENAGVPEKEIKILNLKRNTPEGHQRLKSHHYMNNVLAKRELGSRADLEGVFLTENFFVAEGIVSNIFWVKNGVVFTPSVETGILNGITRQFIIDGLASVNIPVFEGLYRKEDLLSADEIFLTNSIQEVVPVSKAEGAVFPGRNGETAKVCLSLYQRSRFTLHSRLEFIKE